MAFLFFHKLQKIFFSEEIIKIINKPIYSNIKINQDAEIFYNSEALRQILEKIVNCLYEEYIKINAQKVKSKESANVKKKVNRAF